MNHESRPTTVRTTDGSGAEAGSRDIERLVLRVAQLEAQMRRDAGRRRSAHSGRKSLRVVLVAASMLAWLLSPAVTLAATLPNTWSSAVGMPTARVYVASATAPCPGTTSGQCVYIIGGYNGNALSTVEAYDSATNTWASSGNGASCASAVPACMPTARDSLAAATVALCPGRTSGQCVYAIGGYSNGIPLRTVEVYNPATNSWTSSDNPSSCAGTIVACMPTGRGELAATTAPCPGSSTIQCVYAIGGDGSGGNYLHTVEVYNPATNVWSSSDTGGTCASVSLGCMPTGRHDLAAATATCTGSTGQCVYAIGGYDGNAYLQTVEMYNPGTNAWAPSTSGCTAAPACMPTARLRPAAAVAACPGSGGQCVYAIGGEGSSGVTLHTLEVYNPGTNMWTSSGDGGSCDAAMPACMPTAREGLAAATEPCPGSSSGQCVYAVGGENNYGGSLQTVEVYSGTAGLIVGGLPGLVGLGSGGPPPAASLDAGVYGASASGYGGYFHSSSGSALHLDPSATCPPTSGGKPGDLCADTGGNLRFCSGTGSTCAWKALSSGGTTLARVTSFAAARSGSTVAFHWTMADTHGVIGFNLYAGAKRLTPHTITPHHSRTYRYRAHYPERAKFSLHVLMGGGSETTIPAQ